MSSATYRVVLSSFLCLGLGLAMAACGDARPVNPGNPIDEQAFCSTTADCPTGHICTQGMCMENICKSDEDCGTGWTCNLLGGQCQKSEGPTDGNTDGNTDGPTDGELSGLGGPCTTGAQCEAELVCKNGKCDNPSSDNRCADSNDCPRGKICNFSGMCEDGCESNADCDLPKMCHPDKFTCESCSLSNPCGAGKSCVAGVCEDTQPCSDTAQCAAKVDGTVCVAGQCVNCKRHQDCAVEVYGQEGRSCGLSGLCEVPMCSDSYCQQQLGNQAYCDTTQTPPACAISSGGCQNDGQCAGDMVCDLNTSTCVGAGACVGAELTSCQSECQAQGRSCNAATCLCGSAGGSGNGGYGDQCISAADCQPGLNCAMNICSDDDELGMLECFDSADPLEMMLCIMMDGGGMGCASAGVSMLGVAGLFALLRRRRRKD